MSSFLQYKNRSDRAPKHPDSHTKVSTQYSVLKIILKNINKFIKIKIDSNFNFS